MLHILVSAKAVPVLNLSRTHVCYRYRDYSLLVRLLISQIKLLIAQTHRRSCCRCFGGHAFLQRKPDAFRCDERQLILITGQARSKTTLALGPYRHRALRNSREIASMEIRPKTLNHPYRGKTLTFSSMVVGHPGWSDA